MYYEEFAEDVRERVEEMAQEEMPDCVVTIRKVIKNNGVKRRAISIIRKDEKATPTIYLREFYEDYKEGRDFEDICEEIYETYKRGLDKFKDEIDMEEFLDFGKIRDQVYFKLINQELNPVLLKDAPWRSYLDLAIVYYVSMDSDDCTATVLIHNEHLCKWGLTEKDLYEVAYENTLEKRKANILNMKDIVKDMVIERITGSTDILAEDVDYGGKTKDEVEMMVEEEINKIKSRQPMDMYILTNDIKTYGSICMMYPNVLKDFANEQDVDLFIIPSSVHEVILVPKKEGSAKRLTEILNDVNHNSLDPIEILSNKVYSYSREMDEVVIEEV